MSGEVLEKKQKIINFINQTNDNSLIDKVIAILNKNQNYLTFDQARQNMHERIEKWNAL
jgi:hypothetical protein